jgi:hypothetical protein
VDAQRSDEPATLLIVGSCGSRPGTNLVIAPVGAGGEVSLYALKSLDLIADVLGYFTDATAPDSDQGMFVPLAP